MLRKIQISVTGLSLLLIAEWLAVAEETALGEADNFGELISLVWVWGLRIIIPLSVLMLVYAGFAYMSSGGDEMKLTQAKEIMQGSLISVTILLFSGVLKSSLQKPLDGMGADDTGLNNLPEVIQNTTSLLLTFVSGFAAVILVYNGIQYMTAAGDTERLNKAKRNTRFAIAGLVLSVLAYIVIDFVIGFWVG